ncbi:hypothetical protein ACFYPB_41355 [Streptomyces olivaceoviridis]|uniref:hypothetical protein n=1 Tax=Streptomyces olivaceoviridis TaxID=1921 RepID=UPI0036CA42A9
MGSGNDRPSLRPDRRIAELTGGPLEGPLLDLIGFTHDGAGVAPAAELGQFSVGGPDA